MNLPNKLTIGRILLIPIIIAVYLVNAFRDSWILYPSLSVANFLILILFIIGVVTDFFDGHIARKRGLVTNFGKFLDPVADKLLVFTVLLILMDQNAYYQMKSKEQTSLIEWWMIVIILAREFLVSAMRMVAASTGRVVAAVWHGKLKTTIQFITIIFILLGCAVVKVNGEYNYLSNREAYYWIAKVFIYIMMIVTIFSGADYLIKNKDIFLSDAVNKKRKKMK